MADKWMSQLAAASGLPYYPGQGPFGQKTGAVMGNRDGYLMAIGPTKLENRAVVSIIVRFPETQQGATVGTGVEQSLAENPGVTKPAGKPKTALKIGADFLRWDWAYSFGKPQAEKVAALAAALLNGARKSTAPFDGKCEKCHNASTPEVILLDGLPVFYCAGCQQNLEQAMREFSAAYETKETNVPMGLAFGAGAAALGGIAWGLVAYFLKRIFLWGAVIIGSLVGTAFFKGYGKINNLGRVLVGVFTVASVLLGDALFYTLVAARELKIAPSAALFLGMVKHLWELETSSGSALSPIFGLIGAALIVYQLKKPKFTVRFENLGQPSA